VTQSILNSIKKGIGLPETDTSFDVDVLMHINSVLSILAQVGVGPANGIMIEDSTATWESLLGSDPRLNMAKTYMYLQVRLLFDPPATSFLLDAIQKRITELEVRLNVQREGESWTDPFLPAA
jgi:hypothetical protein